MKKRVLRIGACVFAAAVLALPATRASFAQNGQGKRHDLTPPSDDSARVLSHPSPGGAKTSVEFGPKKAADAPAPNDESAPPNSRPGGAPQSVREGRGEGLQNGGVEKAGARSDAKSSPAHNVPAKGPGPAEGPMVIPLPRSAATTGNLRSGNKTFKIVTPGRPRPLRPSGAPAPTATTRNAIGQTVASHDVVPGHGGEPLSRLASQSPGIPVGGAGNVIDANHNGGATRVVAPNSTPSVALSGERRIVGAGPNRSGVALSGLGGPAKTVSGIDGTSVRPKH